MPRQGATATKRFHHGALREALLTAALDAIVRYGIESLSLRDLARSLEVSHGAPYRHFRNKADLLVGLGVLGFTEFRDRLEQAWRAKAGDEDYFARFRRMGWAYMQFAVDEPALFRLMFSRDFSDRVDSEAFKAIGAESFGVLHGAVGEGFERGLLHGKSTIEVATQIRAGVHGLSHLWVEGSLDHADDYDMDVIEFLDDALTTLVATHRAVN